MTLERGARARAPGGPTAHNVGPALAELGTWLSPISLTPNGNVLMLDGEGVCIRVEPLTGRGASLAGLGGPATPGGTKATVRSDASVPSTSPPSTPPTPGGLGRTRPRAGISMLFAAVDQSGRIFCARRSLDALRSLPRPMTAAFTRHPSDTAKQASLAFDDSTDPGLMPLGTEGAEDLETVPYQRPSSNPPPPSSSRHSMRGPPAPPVPRVPRLRPFVAPLSERQPMSVARGSRLTVPVSPAPYAGPGRGLPAGAELARVRLRDSQVAVAPEVRRRG